MSSIVQKFKSIVVLIFLLVLTGGIGAWAQTGTYFIANGNGYKSDDVANNFYLVPATNSNYESDADKPHLTTSKTGKVLNCCWRVEKSGDYYHIIHVADGKYLTANPQYDGTSGNNVGRLRVHLETMTEPDNSTLFEIKTNSKGGYNIRHKDMTDKINNSTTTYLDPAGGNVNGTNLTSLRQMDTSSGKVNVGGGIGYWTDELAARWQFEPVPQNNTYTYNMVDSQGNITVKMTVIGQSAAKALSSYTDIPENIRSPYLAGETVKFYTFSDSYSTPEELLNLLSDENKIVATPVTNNANIYVTYTTDHLSEKFLHLRGARGFNIKTAGGFIYDDNGTLYAVIENKGGILTDSAEAIAIGYNNNLPTGISYIMSVRTEGEETVFNGHLPNADRFEYIKLFVWDSFKSMKPLSLPLTVNVSKTDDGEYIVQTINR